MANELDFAYTAGLMDGDGSIGIYKNKAKTCVNGYRYMLSIRVNVTDKVAPMWLKMIYGGCLRLHRNMGMGKRDMFEWTIAGNKALYVLENCLPFMKTKANEAKVAIEFQKNKYRGDRGRGHKTTVEILKNEEILANRLKSLKREVVIWLEN